VSASKRQAIREGGIGRAVRGLTSWFVLAVGLLAIWACVRWYTGAGGGTDSRHVVVESAQWDQSLVGATVTVPSSDQRGIRIPGAKYILLSFSCSGCVKPGVLEEAVRSANLPVVLVCRGPLRQVPAALLESSFPAWLVLDQEAHHVPASFLDKAPQLALVNSGKIVEVPGKDETAEMFLRRAR